MLSKFILKSTELHFKEPKKLIAHTAQSDIKTDAE